jgi:NAD(P)H-dependent FMN reductase
MKITLIVGSHRQDSQSTKVGRFMQKTLEEKGLCDETCFIDLAGNPLPLWDMGVWEGEPAWKQRLAPLHAELIDSDGFVVITPEWHGQAPAGLKNLFLLVNKDQVGHKPALITSVSAGDGGAYPVAELRMSSYKNNRICYIPEQIIVRNVESVLNDDPAQNNTDADSYFRQRIAYALGILSEYAKALAQVRASGATDNDQFKNGM